MLSNFNNDIYKIEIRYDDYEPENYEYFLFGLDKRESDGYMENDMYICCNGDNKLSEYVTIERLDYPYKPN